MLLEGAKAPFQNIVYCIARYAPYTINTAPNRADSFSFSAQGPEGAAMLLAQQEALSECNELFLVKVFPSG